MSEVANEALRRLLTSAESAHGRGGASRKVTVALTEASFPAYLELARAEDKQAANMAFLAAERAGAVSVDWDMRAGDRSHAVRLVLRDAEALAQYLQAEPRWAAVARAEEILSPVRAAFVVLDEVLERWRRGAKVRNTGPEAARDWLDAGRVLQYCQSNPGVDVAVRRVSAQLFRNSKRIQDIWRLLEVLSTGNLQAGQKDMEEVLIELGLVRFPPTLLLAANADIQCARGVVAAVPPYVGVAPEQLCTIAFSAAPRLVLTVENLTTFHELAASRPSEFVLLYTGGMPPRSWTAAYQKVLHAVPADCVVSHWGDIDAGGFRIASHIAHACADAGRKLRLYEMHWRAPPQMGAGRSFALGEVKQIQAICAHWGWDAEREAIENATHPVEQEELPAGWPQLLGNQGG
jgi:hypothetical protein